ncbi:MAG: lipid A phosphoethanolamine transferase [Alloprevotella sp.]|nr:lipid A phosphoethanolamine transferase [Alloprevotella sp.]
MKLFRIFLSPRWLFLWTLVVLMVPNVWLCFSEQMPLWAALTNILLPLSFYAIVLSLGRSTGKMVWWLFLFIFFAAFQVVLLFLFGNSIIGVDMFLNLTTTNPAEALEVLTNLLWGILTIVALYVPVLVASIIQIRKKIVIARPFRIKARLLAIVGVLLGIGCLVGAYKTTPNYKVRNELYPLNVCYNVWLTGKHLVAEHRYDSAVAEFAFQAKPTHDADEPEIYVLVIGETARADHFGLYGYERPTTPMLQNDTARLIWFTDAIAQSNTTHKSVPTLLSAATAQDYSRLYRERSIVTAFKEAGFHTVYLSNQRRNHSFIDRFGEEADEVLFLKDDGNTYHYDSELLSHTNLLFNSDHRKLFVVLHLYGSHFNYRERYPDTAAKFLPDDASEAVASNRESLVNAYDNTILGTDAVLNTLFHQLNNTNKVAVALYTSDHGENLFDDERHLFLHASPRPSYYDLHVPFIIYTSMPYEQAHPQQQARIEAVRHEPVSTNAAVFHTMLELAGVQTPAFTDTLSLANPAYKCTRRYYLSDHCAPIPIPQLKLSDGDRQQFRSHGLLFK